MTKPKTLVLSALILCAFAAAQQAPPPPASQGEETAMRELEEEMAGVTARATAKLGVVKHLEEVLKDRGLTLHPRLAALRTRVEIAMDAAEAAMKKKDAAQAREKIKRARGYVEQLERAW